MTELEKIDKISNLLTENLNYAYCDNCKHGDTDDYDYCDECYRKYQNWALSHGTAEYLARRILKLIGDKQDA